MFFNVNITNNFYGSLEFLIIGRDMFSNIDYKLLKALDAVVIEQNFERAANRLHITQSAISQRIKLLETQLG